MGPSLLSRAWLCRIHAAMATHMSTMDDRVCQLLHPGRSLRLFSGDKSPPLCRQRTPTHNDMLNLIMATVDFDFLTKRSSLSSCSVVCCCSSGMPDYSTSSNAWNHLGLEKPQNAPYTMINLYGALSMCARRLSTVFQSVLHSHFRIS